MSSVEPIKKHFCFDGRVEFYKCDSKALASSTRFAVFIPPQASTKKTCPAIYCLAGLTCDETTFFIKSGAIAQAARHGLFLVAPDTSPRNCQIEGEEEDWDFGTGASFYLDATQEPWREHYRMASYLTEELPSIVEELFNIDPKKRGIMGHSMGGYGALVHGLSRPDFWSSVSAFAPITHPIDVPWGRKAFENYLGDDQKLWRAHDPVCLLEDGHRFPHPILVDQGLADEFLKDQLQPWHLKEAAQKAQQALIFREHPGYDHSYWFVQSFIEDHINHHGQTLCR